MGIPVSTTVESLESLESTVCQPPSRWQVVADKAFRSSCRTFAWLTVIAIVFIVVRIVLAGIPAMREYGPGFLVGTTWDPNKDTYGILPEIWGTLYSSILSVVIGTAFGVAAAIFLSEGYLGEFVFRALKLLNRHFHPFWSHLPQRMEDLLRNLIELLAAIPSVVYGLWGIFVVVPAIRPACNWLHLKMGWLPLFGTDLSGPGMLPAVLVLSIMILPTITAISRDALTSVPPKLRMAAYGLGATRWETIFAVILPTASRGVFGGVVLAFGRALGETMALAMLVGNSNRISVSLFSPANTLAALLANTFPEARPKEVAVLMYAALVLLAITLIVNILGAIILQQTSKSQQGAH
jgi:phosphate transport system permease protein